MSDQEKIITALHEKKKELKEKQNQLKRLTRKIGRPAGEVVQGNLPDPHDAVELSQGVGTVVPLVGHRAGAAP